MCENIVIHLVLIYQQCTGGNLGGGKNKRNMDGEDETQIESIYPVMEIPVRLLRVRSPQTKKLTFTFS